MSGLPNNPDCTATCGTGVRHYKRERNISSIVKEFFTSLF